MKSARKDEHHVSIGAPKEKQPGNVSDFPLSVFAISLDMLLTKDLKWRKSDSNMEVF